MRLRSSKTISYREFSVRVKKKKEKIKSTIEETKDYSGLLNAKVFKSFTPKTIHSMLIVPLDHKITAFIIVQCKCILLQFRGATLL